MGILKVVIVLGVTFITNLSYGSAGPGVCSGHLKYEITEKLLGEVNKLNSKISPNPNSPEQLYMDLKAEEAGWLKRGYLDYSKPLSQEIKNNILQNHKVQADRFKEDRDYALFYLNQIRFLYIRASKQIYERIISASVGSILELKYKSYVKEIITTFFSHELTSVELSSEAFAKTMLQKPWLMFPWYKALDVIKAWEAQPQKGPREFDRFMAELKQNSPKGLTREHIEVIEKAIRSRERQNEVCCKSVPGCSNCPLNRKYLL